MTTSSTSASSTGASSGSTSGGSSPSGGTSSQTGATTTTPSTKKSVSGWVSCSGTSDDTASLAKAFAAAANGKFTLEIDCPVNVKIGSDIARPIFIDTGTSVEFTANGKFTVDNQYIPAFVIANSSNITLTNWNVEYVGGISVTEATTFENSGRTGNGMPGNMFNDVRLTQWLAANRGIHFDKEHGVNSYWTGSTNVCAVLYLTGDTSDVSLTGMQLYVPNEAKGSQFIPTAITLAMNYKSEQTLTTGLPSTSEYMAVPNHLTFSNIRMDGTYMGFVGAVQSSVFEQITSQRYGDLQDANGNNVGGVQKWFAPPHLFYFNNTSTDSTLFNRSLTFSKIVDSGIRIGRARDSGGSDTRSGYALSLKLACASCTVDTYSSARPDGFMDVLASNGLVISNVTASYDSSFLHDMYPAVRFPMSGYTNIKFENVSLTDTADASVTAPIGAMSDVSNQGLVFANVNVYLSKWAGSSPEPYPVIFGEGNMVQLNYFVSNNESQHVQSMMDTVETEMQIVPAVLKVGQPTKVTWLSRRANSCAGTGSWSAMKDKSEPTAETYGDAVFTPKKAGSYDFTIECRDSGSATKTTVSAQASS